MSPSESQLVTALKSPVRYWWRLKACRRLARQDRGAAEHFPSGTFALLSYPKSGITWLRFMLIQAFSRHFGDDLERLSVQLAETCEEFDHWPNIKQSHDGSELTRESGDHVDAVDLFRYSGRLRYSKADVVLLVRDPRDVVVSYFHQITKRSKTPLSFESMSEYVRHPYYGMSRIIRFMEIWHRNRSVPNRLLLVRYEDLLADGASQLCRITEFLGLDVDRAILEEVYDESRAEKLRKLERKGEVDGMRVFGSSSSALKVRKAKIGSYLEELAPDDIAYCNRLARHLPDWYGYEIK